MVDEEGNNLRDVFAFDCLKKVTQEPKWRQRGCNPERMIGANLGLHELAQTLFLKKGDLNCLEHCDAEQKYTNRLL